MPKEPKRKCCVSKKRCSRCPIRMLQEGTLPDGYAVKKRRLMRVEPDGSLVPVPKEKKGKKKGKKAGKKAKAAKKAKAGKKARREQRDVAPAA